MSVCGGAECPSGFECCLLTTECFDPSSDPGACSVPPEESDPDACASNADCDAGELCERADIFGGDDNAYVACGGLVGHCVMVRGPESCGGFGDGVCGCDGRTYADPCEASRAGVRVSWLSPCGESIARGHYDCDEEHTHCPEGRTCDFELGECRELRPVIACGLDSQCPEGWNCCGFVGACMPADCPDCCFVPPAGTSYPCRSTADCANLEEGRPDEFYCEGPTCGAPGGCRRRGGGCGGAFEPVCGCDGTTYSNACWASEEGVALAHEGECP